MSLLKGYVLILLFSGTVGSVIASEPPLTTLVQLLTDAEQNNLEIKKTNESLRSLKLAMDSIHGRFYPKVSIEGGPQATRYDQRAPLSSSLYGKVEWNLYQGGLDQILLDNKVSEIKTQEILLNSLKNKIKNEISKIYYELQFLLETIDLKKQALELNAQQMKVAQAKHNSGLTTNSDQLEFELQEATLQSDLILCQQQLEQKRRAFDLILSRDTTQPLTIQPEPLSRITLTLKRDELISKIQKNNEQLLESQFQIQQLQSEQQQTESLSYPKLNFEGLYGKLATDDHVFKRWNNYSLNLKLHIPLFSGFEISNALQSYDAKITSAQTALTYKTLALSSELDSILSEIQSINQRLDLGEQNLERSEKYLQLTFGEYRRGIKNSPDMVSASDRLLDVKVKNLEYKRDLILAKIKIQTLIGESI